jgi:DNA-binding XRE family transcriptional regulator
LSLDKAARSINLPCGKFSPREFTVREIFVVKWIWKAQYYRAGYMRLTSTRDFALLVRKARTDQDMTQGELAAACGTGVRFIVDLERGKESCQLEKALIVANMLGIVITAEIQK